MNIFNLSKVISYLRLSYNELKKVSWVDFKSARLVVILVALSVIVTSLLINMADGVIVFLLKLFWHE